MPTADFLLEHGAVPLALGDVLEMARDRGYVEMTQLLERKLASIHGASSEGEPVAAAIRERDLARVRRILDESPQLLGAGDGRSSQPIHWAVMTRQIPIIDELLERGADINARRRVPAPGCARSVRRYRDGRGQGQSPAWEEGGQATRPAGTIPSTKQLS